MWSCAGPLGLGEAHGQAFLGVDRVRQKHGHCWPAFVPSVQLTQWAHLTTFFLGGSPFYFSGGPKKCAFFWLVTGQWGQELAQVESCGLIASKTWRLDSVCAQAYLHGLPGDGGDGLTQAGTLRESGMIPPFHFFRRGYVSLRHCSLDFSSGIHLKPSNCKACEH